MDIKHKANYSIKRREAYPSIADQLDALWKGGEAAEQMKLNIQAIKIAIPKKQKEKQ